MKKLGYRALLSFLLIVAQFNANKCFSQYAMFLREGTIEYERKFNQFSILDVEQSWGKNHRETELQFKTEVFLLDFTRANSIYRPGNTINEPKSFYLSLPAQDNTVFKDLQTKQIWSKRNILGNTFLVEHDADPIQWKITGETRMIAGFECRRANALIFDSVYVVAYYSEQLPISSGPESFSGLPGMILGLAIPDLHTTWFATRISSKSITIPNIIQGNHKEIQRKSKIQSKLKDAFNNHEKYSSIFYIFSIL